MTSDYLNERRDDEIAQSVQADSSSILGPVAAGLGAILLGGAIYGRSAAGGGRLVSNLLHVLGHPLGANVAVDVAANIGKSAPKGAVAGIRSVLTSKVSAKTGRLQLGPIDLIDDLRSVIDVVTEAPADVGRRISAHFTEYINREFSHKTIPSFFAHDLNRITIDEVLKDRDSWFALIGKNQWEVLEKGKNLGLVSGNTILDKRIFTSSTGIVRDTRISSIFTKPVLVQGQGGPIYERVLKLDFFGQGRVATSMLGEPRRFATLAPDRSFKGHRFFVDGSIYGYTRDTAGTLKEHVLDTGRTIVRSDSPLRYVSSAFSGDLKLVPKERKGFFGSKLTAFEKYTGVGPSYADRSSLLDILIKNPYKRFTALASGEGLIWKQRHKYTGSMSQVGTQISSLSIPEAVFSKGVVTPVPGGGAVEYIQDLSMMDRLKVIFGVHDEYSVIKARSATKTHLSRDDLIVSPPEGGVILHKDKFIPGSLGALTSDSLTGRINLVGDPIESGIAKFIDVKGSRLANRVTPNLASLRMGANYLIHRINSLASASLLGIGFAPAKTLLGNVSRMAAIPLIYEGMRQGVDYVDYLSEEYLGFSPVKAGADLYANLRLTQQKIRETLGIQQGLRWADENFPGIVNSEGATLARSVALPLVAGSAALKTGRFGLAAGLAATIYAAIGGPDPGQTSEELKDEYLGNTKVPIRKGRFWGLGYLGLFGGDVEYYDYSWYHKLQTDAKTKSMYGSRSEYFQYHANVLGIPFPTPHNLFGLRNIMNPYRWEEIHAKDRPYPVTGNNLDDFPVAGPLLSMTLGRVFKPVVHRQMEMPLLQAGLVQRGLDPNTAKILGMSNLEVSEYGGQNEFIYQMNKLANVASEPLGVYKFVMEFMGVKLTPQVTTATSNIATSAGREFYGQGYGGALGQTEFTRRFFLSDYNNPHYINRLTNTIRNTQPTWMPGSYSEYERDQSYFLDFSVGDPYTKIARGDTRLPGPGYEALSPLHSGRPGEYDDVDRFLVLSDVAPYSDAYRHYDAKMKRMKLDPYWQKRVEDARKYTSEMIGVDKRYLRYEDTLSDLNQATKDSAIYKILRKSYDALTHDFLAELPYVGSKLFPFRNPYEQYRKLYVEGSQFASWNRPWEGIARPMLYDMASVNPLMAAIKGAGVGYLATGPLAFFSPMRSDFGVNVGAMYKGAIAGAMLSSMRVASGLSSDFIPPHIQTESNALSYMESVNYLKYRALEEAAREGGFSDVAKQFANQSRKTLVGANNPLTLRAALPRSADKRYFDYFLNAPMEQRDQIYNGVPGFMRYALSTAWVKNYPSREEADANAATVLGNVPNEDWVGWHPSVTNVGTKLSLIKHGINGISHDYHRFGIYESQENDIQNRIPAFYSQDFDMMTIPRGTPFSDILAIKKDEYLKQFGNADVSSYSTFNRVRRTINVNIDRTQDTINAVRYNYGR